MSRGFRSPLRVSLTLGSLLLGSLLQGCKPADESKLAAAGTHHALRRITTLEVPASSDTSSNSNSAHGSVDSLQAKVSLALEQGDFVAAVKDLEHLAELKPQDEEVFFNLGYAHTRARQTNEAIRSYVRCLDLLPTYAEAHNNLGNLLLSQKRFPEAEVHFRAALTNQPENSLTYNNLGKWHAVQSRPQEGIPLFREAIRLNPKNWEARHNLAVAYLTLGMLEESRAELKMIVDENPEMAIARKTLSRVESLRQGRSGTR